MIENQYLFPECYINKIPKCDKCKCALSDTNMMNTSNPPQWIYRCPKCNLEYTFYETELRGEWRWRTI